MAQSHRKFVNGTFTEVWRQGLDLLDWLVPLAFAISSCQVCKDTHLEGLLD